MTRRKFALGMAGAAAASAQSNPIRRYFDPSTEVEVLALSDPAQASYLPHHGNRSVSSRNGFLVYSTETANGFQAQRLEVKGGATRLLTTASALEPRSLALSPDDRTLYYADGDLLLGTGMSGGKPRQLYQGSAPEIFQRGLSLSDDGTNLVLIDQKKLVLVPTAVGRVSRTLAEVEASQATISKSGQVFVRGTDASISVIATTAGAKMRKLPIEGELGPALWSPDGRSILYLKVNQGKGIPNALFEFSLDANKEALVGKTSQFVDFGRNADSSVFVGASGSKAQPFILIMLRITRREMALCEHKSSDPGSVSPVFSPSSQRIYFQSDRLGKPAIFSVAVEKLVERTEQDDPPGKKS
ncbi:TolB family protein [Bryobacter aggregatus]|uniref:TolB family protein n=1 Tax=Bryobacter aggregatus TaxID=360054 RepID=UPI00138E1F44|nr:PD40 domain-containing protein [Bryobacter aggregatus]